VKDHELRMLAVLPPCWRHAWPEPGRADPASVGEDDHSQIWIGKTNGLPLKSEPDNQRAGHTTHASAHFTYGDVNPPVGMQ
jgi:hypothetical protein